jgi:hypothetical protein
VLDCSNRLADLRRIPRNLGFLIRITPDAGPNTAQDLWFNGLLIFLC